MKTVWIFIFVLMFVCVGARRAVPLQGGVPQLVVPDAEKHVLQNKMSLYYLEDKSLPLVNVTIYFRFGSTSDPIGQGGLVELAVSNMIDGGTDNLSPEQFNEELKFLGAQYSAETDIEYSYVSLSVVSDHAKEALNIFLRAFSHPRFDREQFELSKKLLIEDVRREENLPDKIVSKSFLKQIYGEKNPFSNYPVVDGIRQITKKQIKDFYSEHVGPSKMVVAVSGNIDLKMVKEIFEKVETRDVKDVPTVQNLNLDDKPKFSRISRPMITNSFIRMGHLGIKRNNPDRFAIEVMNFILGGRSFQSKLLKSIRSKKGLVYGIYSKFTPLNDNGTFVVAANTAAGNEQALIDDAKRIITNIHLSKDISESDVMMAKRSLLFSQMFNFDTPESVVNMFAQYELLGYPHDYWKIYREQVAKITLKDVKEVAGKYLKPDRMNISIVGPKKDDKEDIGGQH